MTWKASNFEEKYLEQIVNQSDFLFFDSLSTKEPGKLELLNQQVFIKYSRFKQ